MRSARVKIILSLIFIGQLLSACSTAPVANTNLAQPNTNQNRPSASDKSEELELLIKIPAEPEETVFREDAANAVDGIQPQYAKKLTAVLKYSAAESVKLSESLEKSSPPLSASINVEPWFPAELIAQSDLSGDDTVKGYSYPALPFFQPPYNEGTITRIEGTNYFILELYV